MLSKEQMLDLWAAWWLKTNSRGAPGSSWGWQCQWASLLSVNGAFCRAPPFTCGTLCPKSPFPGKEQIDIHINVTCCLKYYHKSMCVVLKIRVFFNPTDSFQILPESFFFWPWVNLCVYLDMGGFQACKAWNQLCIDLNIDWIAGSWTQNTLRKWCLIMWKILPFASAQWYIDKCAFSSSNKLNAVTKCFKELNIILYTTSL